MLLYDDNGEKYEIYSCKRPKMSDRSRGTTWDSIYKTIDTVKRQFFLDTTWGIYMYFMYNGIWYKIGLSGNAYDIRNFYTNNDLSIDPEKVEKDKINVEFDNTLMAWNSKCYYTMDKKLEVNEVWETMLKDNSRMSRIELLKNFQDFKQIISNPTKAQNKIIKCYGVRRINELI